MVWIRQKYTVGFILRWIFTIETQYWFPYRGYGIECHYDIFVWNKTWFKLDSWTSLKINLHIRD